LFVAYFASAELGPHLSLDWPMPERVLDLHEEFRCLTNGFGSYAGNGLLGAMSWYGLDAMDAAEIESMRKLDRRGADRGRNPSGGPCSIIAHPMSMATPR
jgi:DNA polymerase I